MAEHKSKKVDKNAKGNQELYGNNSSDEWASSKVTIKGTIIDPDTPIAIELDHSSLFDSSIHNAPLTNDLGHEEESKLPNPVLSSKYSIDILTYSSRRIIDLDPSMTSFSVANSMDNSEQSKTTLSNNFNFIDIDLPEAVKQSKILILI
jgi:hypothetical protein